MSVTVNKTRLPGSVIKTATGAVASVSDARMRGAIGVEASFEPKQDLHGYANPWVAGAGKNKWKASFPPDVLGTYAGWYIPWTSKLNVTIHDKGNDADISGLYFGVSDTGTYTPVRWLVSNGIVQTTHLYYENLPTSVKHYISIYQNREESLQRFLNRFDVMVTIDADAKNENQPYEPYENLCPISGITSASAFVSQQYPDANPRSVTAQLGEERYGGSYDFVRGKLTLTWNIVDLSTLNYSRAGGIDGVFVFATVGITDRKHGVTNLISDCFKTTSTTAWSKSKPDNSICGSATSTTVVIRADQYSTAAELKTAMSGRKVAYELATPIVIDMTPAEFELFHRQNYVWSDVGDTKLTYAAIKQHGG